MLIPIVLGAALGYWLLPEQTVPRIGAIAIGGTMGYAVSASLQKVEQRRELGREVMLRAMADQHRSEISAQKTRP